MLNKKYKLILFALMVLAQLYIPAKMIWDSQTTILKGVEYNFLLRPVDPTDFFRGKYISLDYVEDRCSNSRYLDIKRGDRVNVEIKKGSDGFAKITQLHDINYPPTVADYFEASVSDVWGGSDSEYETIHLELPFQRLYMEESKAQAAEDLARSMIRDSTNQIYGKISINKGTAVLKNVFINEISISEMVESNKVGPQ